jgi:hypothetical protein
MAICDVSFLTNFGGMRTMTTRTTRRAGVAVRGQRVALDFTRWLCMALLLCQLEQRSQRFANALIVLPHRLGAAPRTSATRLAWLPSIIQQAFANDDSLSKSDLRTGSIEDAQDDDDVFLTANPSPTTLTERQRAFRAATGLAPPRLDLASLDHVAARLDLFLTGVPQRDPSNDLYNSRENISARNRAIDAVVPSTPTIRGVGVVFLPNEDSSGSSGITGVCRCATTTDFTTAGALGEWRLFDDTLAASASTTAKKLRFRFPVLGYTRTIQTTGSIQKIYWTQGNDNGNVIRTSTTYEIPPGFVYGEVSLSWTRKSGGTDQILQWGNDGVLKVEQSSGLFGVSTKLVPCGVFEIATVEPAAASPLETSETPADTVVNDVI